MDLSWGIQGEGSERRILSGFIQAEEPEWRDPSKGIRVEGSERLDSSGVIRVE